nr:hypothetical protein Itr_chr01CG19260 [Ipomoea trifida]
MQVRRATQNRKSITQEHVNHIWRVARNKRDERAIGRRLVLNVDRSYPQGREGDERRGGGEGGHARRIHQRVTKRGRVKSSCEEEEQTTNPNLAEARGGEKNSSPLARDPRVKFQFADRVRERRVEVREET